MKIEFDEDGLPVMKLEEFTSLLRKQYPMNCDRGLNIICRKAASMLEEQAAQIAEFEKKSQERSDG